MNKKRAKGALLKMLHGISPTQEFMKKINLTKYSECPCCKEENEDIHHVLRCEIRAQDAKDYFINKSKTIGSSGKDHEELFIQIWESVIYGSNKINTKWPVNNQDDIGWDYLLKGLISKDWKEVIEFIAPKKQWEEVMSDVIVAIWQTWLEMWKNRNESIDSNARYCAQVQNDNNRLSLQIIYSLQDMLSPIIQRVMRQSLSEHLKMHRDQVSDWLTMYRQIIKQSIDEQDPDIWQNTREHWISQINSEE